MRERTKIWLALGAVVCALALYSLSRAGSEARERRRQTLESAQPDMHGLTTARDNADDQQQHNPQQPAVAETGAPAREAREAALARIGRAVTAPLEHRWAQEPKDPRLNSLEQEIEDFFHDPRLAGLELVSVGCRTTLCRYEIELDERSALRTLFQVAEEVRPFEGAFGIPVIQGNRMSVYLAPPGMPLFRDSLPPDQARRLMARFTGVPL